MSALSSDIRIFKPGDIVFKRYTGMPDRFLYVLKDLGHIHHGHYWCYDLTDLNYIDVFLGYSKKSNKVKKVA